jgi:hypothetical protein
MWLFAPIRPGALHSRELESPCHTAPGRVRLLSCPLLLIGLVAPDDRRQHFHRQLACVNVGTCRMQFMAVLIRIIRYDGVLCAIWMLSTGAGDNRHRIREKHFEHHGRAVNLSESPSFDIVPLELATSQPVPAKRDHW